MPQRNAVEFNVYADGVATFLLQPLRMIDSAGSKRLDNAVLEYDSAGLDGFNPSGWLNTLIEIQRVDTAEIVHFGKVSQLPILIKSGDGGGETLEIVSRADLYLLGAQLDGYIVYDPIGLTTPFIDGDLVFNPMVDGVISGNMNDTHNTAAGCLVFLDPESVRTPAAQTLQGANAVLWTLPQAVFYLLWALNTPQTYITNPGYSTLAAVFNDPNAKVQEVRIPRGTYLAQALDMLIEPLGYRWRIKRTALGARTYEFWKAGTGGSLVTVHHKPFGTALTNPRNLAEQDVDTVGVTFDVSSLANQIDVLGGFEEYEITAELERGWNYSYDPIDNSNAELFYAKDSPVFDTYRNVLRKWVLNEAGDYIGSRPTITSIFPAALRSALNSLGLLSHFIPRRRKLMPTLTLKTAISSSVHDVVPIGTLHGIEVEYSNTTTPNWIPVSGWEVANLEQECGIYFDCEKLPEVFFQGDGVAQLRIRITATIQGDNRLRGTVTRNASSPNDDVVPLVLDLPDRFRYRVRHSSLSKYGGGALPSRAVNEQTAVNNFASYVRDVFDVMDVNGAIQIEGLDNAYKVGDRVKDVQTKNISFLGRTASGSYPQIIGIERDVENQITVLHLERYREPIVFPTTEQGTTEQFRPRHSSRKVL